jgi:hypothetical protein
MAYTDREDLNYLGMLYKIGANQTPFLNAIGGLNGGKTTNSFPFPVAQPWSLTSASQPAITEAASVSSNTATTYTRAQDINTVQIFQYTVEVSHAKQSTWAEVSGISMVGDQPVKNEFEFQKAAALRQMAVDVDYSFLQGAYQAAADASTAAKTKGLKNAISTNTVAGGSAALTKTMIDTLLQTMAGNGSVFSNPVAVCNAFQKTKFSEIYGYAPEDRNIGGVNIKQVETDFAILGIMYDPHMPTDEIYIVDMAVCSPVFCPYEGSLVTYEDLAQVAASKKGQWYAQIGLDFGPEEYHGSITGLATS